jgi:hypothetical protein
MIGGSAVDAMEVYMSMNSQETQGLPTFWPTYLDKVLGCTRTCMATRAGCYRRGHCGWRVNFLHRVIRQEPRPPQTVV